MTAENIISLAQVEQERRPPEFTDESLALRFAAKHADELRYVAAWGRWFEWDGARWRQDDTLRAFDLARAICRTASAECNKDKIAAAVASAKTVAAIERLAKADRRLAATVGQWDQDPWLLNTPSGTVDLRTGDMRPHRREDYCTKSTAIAPGGACPRWLGFLDRTTGGDKDLALFLQRVAGYALTGSIREHALFFGHGTGGNGKGVFVNTISGVMGDYATTAPMETFIASNSDRHPTELAGLRGARLVTAQETEEGRAADIGSRRRRLKRGTRGAEGKHHPRNSRTGRASCILNRPIGLHGVGIGADVAQRMLDALRSTDRILNGRDLGARESIDALNALVHEPRGCIDGSAREARKGGVEPRADIRHRSRDR